MTSTSSRKDFDASTVNHLESAYLNGMTSSSDNICQEEIVATATQTGLSITQVKSWIGNRRARDSNSKSKIKKKTKVLRQGPNSYSLFARSVERGSSDRSTYLKNVSQLWRGLTDEEKQLYQKNAEKLRKDPTHGNNRDVVIKDQLNGLRTIVQTLESVDYHIGGYGMDAQGGQPSEFHSTKAKPFFNKMEDFEKFIRPSTVNMPSTAEQKGSKPELRKELRKHLHSCWMKSSGVKSLPPYKEIKINKTWVVKGMPNGLPFGDPSSYGVKNMKRILKCNISFEPKEQISCDTSSESENPSNNISDETHTPETHTPETHTPGTHAPETYTPGTHAPETHTPESETYTASDICLLVHQIRTNKREKKNSKKRNDKM